MRLKDVVILRNEKTTDTSRPYIALENIISWDAKYIESSIETEGTNSVFKPNDILFGKLRPYLAKGFIPSYEGICSTEFFVLKAKKGYYTQYLLYLLLSHSFIDYIKNQVAGVKMPRTNWETFSSIEVSIPPLQVQQRIVEYLDAKTTEIDNKIELLGKKRDAYNRLKTATINRAVTRGLDEHVKLKDSGIEWLGEIPAHWDVKRIKDIGVLKLGKMLDEKPKEGYQCKPYLKSKNVGWLSLNLNDVEEMYFDTGEREMLKLKEGDLVISEGGEVGKTSIWNGELIECYIQNSVHKLTVDKKYDSRYYLYLSFILGQTGYYKSIVNLVSIMHLTFEKLRKVIVLCPPLEEQKQIAAYLDERCAKIDAAVTIIDKQIYALKRLKRSLINEVVTGKRMV